MQVTAGELWARTHAAVRARFSDYALIAAAFAFLPNVVLSRFAPENPFALFGVAFIGLAGQIAIVRMTVRPETDTGDAIRGAFTIFLPALGLTILSGVAMFVGFLALVLPGLYLLARLLPALPALVAGAGGIEASLRRAWALTDGKAAPILGVAAAFILIFLISAFLAGGVAAVISGGGEKVSLLGAILISGVAATFSIYYSVLQGTVWRTLTAA